MIMINNRIINKDKNICNNSINNNNMNKDKVIKIIINAVINK